jgi:hypothetical protein
MLFLRWSLNYDFGEVQPETVGGILAASPENTGGKAVGGKSSTRRIFYGRCRKLATPKFYRGKI